MYSIDIASKIKSFYLHSSSLFRLYHALLVLASREDARTFLTEGLEPHRLDNASTESFPSQLPGRTTSEPQTGRRKSGRVFLSLIAIMSRFLTSSSSSFLTFRFRDFDNVE